MTGQCEVCGKPATVFVCDLQETPPIRLHGVLWPTWQKQENGEHAFCAEHKRPPRKTYLRVGGYPFTPAEKQESLFREQGAKIIG
jgi:hypothetical protein